MNPKIQLCLCLCSHSASWKSTMTPPLSPSTHLTHWNKLTFTWHTWSFGDSLRIYWTVTSSSSDCYEQEDLLSLGPTVYFDLMISSASERCWTLCQNQKFVWWIPTKYQRLRISHSIDVSLEISIRCRHQKLVPGVGLIGLRCRTRTTLHYLRSSALLTRPPTLWLPVKGQRWTITQYCQSLRVPVLLVFAE